jgi:hypothetical protein
VIEVVKRIYLDKEDYKDLKDITPKAKNDSERIRILIQKIKEWGSTAEIVENAVSKAIEELKRY